MNNRRGANALTAAVLLVALPLATEHAMPRLILQAGWLTGCLALSLAIAAVSLNLLYGYAGQLSLGHAALLGVGAFTAGLVTSKAGLPIEFGLPAAVLVSALVALVVGLPALRLQGLYLAVVTVVFAIAMQYCVFLSAPLSGGSAGIELPRRFWGGHYLTDNAQFFAVCAVALVGVCLLDANLRDSRLGRALCAIRENEDSAAVLGISVTRYKLAAFVISGGMAGLAGALYGASLSFVNDETFQLSRSLALVAIVVVGGAGYRTAVVLAAISFELMPDLLHLSDEAVFVIGAVLLMITLARNPGGLAHALTRHRRPPENDDDDLEAAAVMPPLPDLPLPAPRVGRGGTVLEVHDVHVHFGGLVAVDGASLRVPSGQIVGLIGPNGAGKSTLFNAITGLVRTDRGAITLHGQRIDGLRCDQRARLGMARSFQQIGLAKDLSVQENLLLAQHQHARYSDLAAALGLPRARRVETELAAVAEQVLAGLGLDGHAAAPLNTLSGGQQRLVEIGCLLATAPELLLLDEPSAGMAPAAVESLADRLRELRDRLGRTVLLIEHNIPLVLDTCDYVYVLDAGRLLAEGRPDEVARQPEVVAAYFGPAVTV